jgi:D-glycero-D-manno-heptose 1,7-bisphosphate phosphatase
VSRAAIFLDRDGTLNELVPDPVSGKPESPLRALDVALIPGAASAARRMLDAGWLLIGVSNQPAAAKGVASREELAAVQSRVLELLAEAGVAFLDFRICPHHPAGVIEALSHSCDCRKPMPGMLLHAAAAHDVDLGSSWMIGDTDADVLAGQAAGCRTILLEHPGSGHKRSGTVRATLTAPGLSAATDSVLNPSW